MKTYFMKKTSIIEDINTHFETIKKSNQKVNDIVLELAILKTFLVRQELFPEMDEFRSLIHIELEKI